MNQIFIISSFYWPWGVGFRRFPSSAQVRDSVLTHQNNDLKQCIYLTAQFWITTLYSATPEYHTPTGHSDTIFSASMRSFHTWMSFFFNKLWILPVPISRWVRRCLSGYVKQGRKDEKREKMVIHGNVLMQDVYTALQTHLDFMWFIGCTKISPYSTYWYDVMYFAFGMTLDELAYVPLLKAVTWSETS